MSDNEPPISLEITEYVGFWPFGHYETRGARPGEFDDPDYVSPPDFPPLPTPRSRPAAPRMTSPRESNPSHAERPTIPPLAATGIDSARRDGGGGACTACGSTANPHSDEQCERNQQRQQESAA